MEYLPGQSINISMPDLNFESIWKYIRNLVSAIEYCKYKINKFKNILKFEFFITKKVMK